MNFSEILFLKRLCGCFHGNAKKMVTSQTCFFHSVKHEVLFLAVKLCRYGQLTASLWNMGLKMMKNDNFQYLDTPPTFEAQL